jgi:alpha-D-ribose 1-methylphosphonate 5-triphosphate diphosphatase PhnM
MRNRSTRPELVVTNARIVTADEMIDGTLVVGGGEIRSVDRGLSRAYGAIDFAG